MPATSERVWLGYEQRWYSGPTTLWYVEWYEMKKGREITDDWDPVNDTDCFERRFPSEGLALAHAKKVLAGEPVFGCVRVGRKRLQKVCRGLHEFEEFGEAHDYEADELGVATIKE